MNACVCIVHGNAHLAAPRRCGALAHAYTAREADDDGHSATHHRRSRFVLWGRNEPHTHPFVVTQSAEVHRVREREERARSIERVHFSQVQFSSVQFSSVQFSFTTHQYAQTKLNCVKVNTSHTSLSLHSHARDVEGVLCS
jgi:hypothetical protein